jgi:hypothetical protein
MGFFNILETFFFISLAITFVLIMMLVYHFKGRISVLEQKCDTMFEIMNNIVKEMRNIKTFLHNSGGIATSFNPEMMVPNNETIMFCQRPNLGEIYQNYNNEHDEEDDEEDDEDEDEGEGEGEYECEYESSKIIVSDTEAEYDQPVKVINIDFDNQDDSIKTMNNIDIVDIVDTVDNVDNVEDIVTLQDEVVNNEKDIEYIEREEMNNEDIDADIESEEGDAEETISSNEYLDKSIDYKKMDISYLRTMVITRGLATDTKKLKKNDLIRLLEQSQ